MQVLGNAKGKKFGPKEESIEHSRGRFLSTKEHRPPWQLSDAEQHEFDEKFSSFPFPDSFGSAPKKPFADASRLKGNDYCHILSDIGIYALKGALGDEQRHVLQQLCRILHALTRTTLSMHALYVLEQELLETLAGWELHFPYYCCTINFHLLLHLPQQIRRCGPVPFWWMYSLERECGRLVDSIHSLKCAEESMVRNYLITEMIEHRRAGDSQYRSVLEHRHCDGDPSMLPGYLQQEATCTVEGKCEEVSLTMAECDELLTLLALPAS